MAIRLSGLTSGMDTDAIVQEMVKAYSLKTEKYEKATTKLTWKQDAWKNLNTKIYSLYTSASNMRLSSAYNLRKVSVSDNTKATITANSDAVTGTQKLNILKTAQTGYITGGDLGKDVKFDTKLSELGFDGGNTTIEVKKNDGTTERIKVTKNTTVNEFVSALKDAGLNASFDESNHRLFISSKESGVANDFALSGVNEDGENVLKALGLDTALATTVEENGVKKTVFTASAKAYQEAYETYYLKAKEALGKDDITVDDVKTFINNQIDKYDELLGQRNIQAATYERSKAEYERLQSELEGLQKKYDGVDVENRLGQLDGEAIAQAVTDAQTAYDAQASVLATLEEELAALDPASSEYEAKQTEISAARMTLTNCQVALDAANADQTEFNELTRLEELPDKVDEAKSAYEAAATTRKSLEDQMAALNVDSFIKTRGKKADDGTYPGQALMEREIFEMAERAVKGNEILTDTIGVYQKGGATKIDATDAVIKLNGVEFTSASNTFTINGLTINATAVTGDGDGNAVQVTTSVDSQAIYDKVKDFLTEYNNVINEMCKLYNAESAGEYEPLTDEEKEAMSEEQIEKWEGKIKDSLLRRDGTLNSIMTTMVNSMAQVIEIDGEKLSLSTFGIGTLGFLNAAENEHYAYHIDGDEDDDNTSGKEDELMKAIEEDPDRVMEFMKKLTGNLYTAIDQKMKSTDLSSAYKVYNDKEMDKQLASYAETIAKWEERVKDKEDYYYDKFSQMEVALSKLQNQTSSISGLFNM